MSKKTLLNKNKNNIKNKTIPVEIKNNCINNYKKNKQRSKQCIDINLCEYTKCDAEMNDYNAHKLTDKEYKQFYNKKTKYLINKRKIQQDKHAILENCIANKCPQKLDFLINGVKNFKKTRKSNNHCSKCNALLNKLESCEIQSEIDLHKCNKKFKDYNKQNKCFSKNFKKNIECSIKYYKCKNEHCIKNKENTKNNTSKKIIKKIIKY
jgi:hypothetical protein